MSKVVEITLPVNGDVLPLTDVNDYLFNKKIIGDGVAVNPKDNFIYAPVDGEIILVYESKHAIAIKTEEGLQVLIHVGIDSVKLEGRGIASYVKVGETVKRGDKILFFDRAFLEKKASPITPIVITNPEIIKDMDINFKASKASDILLSVQLK